MTLSVIEDTKIKLGDIEIDAYLLSDKSYGLSQTQVAEAIGLLESSFRSWKGSKMVESLSAEVLRSASVTISKGGRAKIVTPYLARMFWRYWDKQGNTLAQGLVDACVDEAIETRIESALGILVEAEERNIRFKARMLGKVTRRSLTDSIQDYDKSHAELTPDKRKWLYKTTTDKLYKLLFNQNAKQLRELLNTKNPRDKLSAHDLLEVDRVENLAMKLIDGMDMYPPEAVDKAFRLQLMVAKQPDIVS